MSDAKHNIVLRFLAQPMDVNFAGNIHGGSVMKWLDQAGYLCATTWSGKYCVTVFAGDMNFSHPIHIGDLVEVHAKIIHTGRTSMHISINIQACNPVKSKLEETTHCLMVFVAVDEMGKPVAVPVWQPKAHHEIQLEQYAINIMALRKRNQELFVSDKMGISQ